MYRGGGTKDAEGGASRQEEESRATEKTDGGDAEGERRGRVLTQHTCQSKQPPPSLHCHIFETASSGLKRNCSSLFFFFFCRFLVGFIFKRQSTEQQKRNKATSSLKDSKNVAYMTIFPCVREEEISFIFL